MLKKISFPEFTPACLCENPSGWCIRWEEVNPDTQKLQAFRRRFQINRIKSITERRRYGRLLAKKINLELYTRGNYFFSIAEVARADMIPRSKQLELSEALDHALDLQRADLRKGTIIAKESVVRKFQLYLQDYRIDALPLGEVDRLHLRPYFHELKTNRSIGAHAYNNHLSVLGGLFNALIEAGLIKENPLRGIKRRRKPQKNRLAFSLEQVRKLLPFFQQQDLALYQAILIQLFCLVRPNEIRHLRPRDFDFSKGLIQIDGKVSKNHRTAVATIPKQIEGILKDYVDLVPADRYLFSTGLQPGWNPCGKNAFNMRHQKILATAVQQGLLHKAENLSFYSWKDTGITFYSQQVSLLATRDQARHSHIDQTLMYYHQQTVNDPIRQIDLSALLVAKG